LVAGSHRAMGEHPIPASCGNNMVKVNFTRWQNLAPAYARRTKDFSVLPSCVQAHIQPPAAVKAADLLTQAWPADAPYRPHTSAFLVMSPSGSYTDFRLPGGGSGLWCHVVSGSRTFALCPPSPRNLAIYAAWASAARHSAVSDEAGGGRLPCRSGFGLLFSFAPTLGTAAHAAGSIRVSHLRRFCAHAVHRQHVWMGMQNGFHSTCQPPHLCQALPPCTFKPLSAVSQARASVPPCHRYVNAGVPAPALRGRSASGR
jgi:hypothetical protein